MALFDQSVSHAGEGGDEVVDAGERITEGGDLGEGQGLWRYRVFLAQVERRLVHLGIAVGDAAQIQGVSLEDKPAFWVESRGEGEVEIPRVAVAARNGNAGAEA